MRKRLIFMVSFLAVLAAFVGAGIYYLYYIPVSYVGVDINPSVQLSLNRMGRVIEAIPLNEDADVLLSDMDLNNLTSEDAVEKIVSSSADMGYVDELAEDNAIAVSVSADNDGTSTELEEKINTKLQKFLSDNSIPALVLLEKDNDERKTAADAYGISYGKMLLIEKAVALDSTLVESELAEKSVQEIAKLIIASRKEIIEARVEAKKELVQAKQEIKATYQENHRKAVQNLIQKSGKTNENLSEQEKAQIVEKAKEQIKGTVKEVQNKIQGKWSNVTDNNQNNVPASIKEKINSIKNKWSGGHAAR